MSSDYSSKLQIPTDSFETDRILHGDCLGIMERLPDNSVDMIFTDPPYSTTKLNFDKGFRMEKYLPEMKRILKSDGWLFCFGSLEIGASLLDYFTFKFQHIWLKNNSTVTHANAIQPLSQHENIWCMYHHDLKRVSALYMDKPVLRTEGKPYVRPIQHSIYEYGKVSGMKRSTSTSLNEGYREGTTILRAPNKQHLPKSERTKHPTQKPLEMCMMLCKAYCRPGGLVFDPFMGSGTIPLAAKNAGRRYLGVEINESYYNMAEGRFAKQNAAPKQSTAPRQDAIKVCNDYPM